MLGSAALHDGPDEASQWASAVVLDIAGRHVDLDPGDAVRLRDGAAALAGRSVAARDLSLLLDRALRLGRVLVLRRSEAHLLAPLANDLDLLMLASEISPHAA